MLPNLLFLFTDEQRADTMGAYGNAVIQTPSLDRLARQSFVFDRAYVTQPVCTPSRSSILTGLYPHTNGCTENNIPLSTDVPCLPEMLPPGEYIAAYHGKWHLGDEVFAQHGFDEWRSIEDSYRRYYGPDRDPNAHSTYHGFLVGNGLTPRDGEYFSRDEAARLPEQYGKPAYLAREASRFIRENRERPFVLFVNFLEPHMPFFGPRDGQHDAGEVQLPANFDSPPSADQPLRAHLFRRYWYEQGLRTEADWRELIANYWGLCSLVDTHVGTILRTLEGYGLADKTIVVYTSDHGDMMGSHRLVAKCVMFEEAVRVPLLVRLPGQTNTRRVRQPVSQIDLVPTLLDLMGEPVQGHLQGKSLKPLLEERADTDKAPVFIEWNGPDTLLGPRRGTPMEDFSVPDWALEMASREQIISAVTDPVRTVITPDGWKFSCSPLGEHELYNLDQDPLEVSNLANNHELHPLMNRMAASMRRWQDKTGDTVAIPASLFDS